MPIKLTDKQIRFVDEYFIDFNATQAAIRSGYSKRSAYSIGQANMEKPEILERLQVKRNGLSSKFEITPERNVQALAKIGYSEGKGTRDGDKIKALEVINKMLGFNAPERREHDFGESFLDFLKKTSGE